MIHTLVTRDDVADAENVFALAPSTSLQAEKLADYLVNTRKYRRIVVITDTTSFGQEGRDALDRALGDLGVTPRLSLEFEPGGDVHTPVAHAGQVSADAAIVWVFNPSEAARIVVETQQHGVRVPGRALGQPRDVDLREERQRAGDAGRVPRRDAVGRHRGPGRGSTSSGSSPSTRGSRPRTAPRRRCRPRPSTTRSRSWRKRRATRTATTGADLIAGLEKITDFEGAGVPVTFGADDHSGIDLDDLGMYGFSKDQDSSGGEFFPDVDTGGGFFTIVTESLELPQRYRFLVTRI